MDIRQGHGGLPGPEGQRWGQLASPEHHPFLSGQGGRRWCTGAWRAAVCPARLWTGASACAAVVGLMSRKGWAQPQLLGRWVLWVQPPAGGDVWAALGRLGAGGTEGRLRAGAEDLANRTQLTPGVGPLQEDAPSCSSRRVWPSLPCLEGSLTAQGLHTQASAQHRDGLQELCP